jgi:Predicted membrane protein
MADLVLYLGITIVGYFIGSRLRGIKEKLRWTGKVQTVAIIILVFVMGLRMGANREVIANLNSIGLYALAFTVVVMVMTTVCISITRRLLKIDRYGLMQNPMDNIAINEESIEVDEIEEISVGEATQKGHDKRGKVDTMTIKILVSVVLGMISGYLFVDDLFSSFDVFNTFASLAIKLGLCTLLVFVGMDLGLDGKVVDNFKKVGIRIMAIPLAAIVGTLIGSALCGIFLPVSMKESLAIGAGFGWYSLAPGIIMDKGYVIAGAISFMHNVMRELLAIITIPMVAKHVGFVECCGLPGASAMDVCLPIVERATSSNTAVYSFVSGVVLSIAVPIMVPLIIG